MRHFLLYFLVPILILFSCDNEQTEIEEPTVIAVDCFIESEYKTIMVFPEDNGGDVEFKCYDATLEVSSLTNGWENTQKIVSACSDNGPAQICDQLVAFGYDDWYLPSRDELNCLFHHKDEIGGFETWDYWSSTEYPEGSPWVQYFNHGYPFSGIRTGTASVRCIRCDERSQDKNQ